MFEALPKFLSDNFLLIFAVVFAWTIIGLVFRIAKCKRNRPVFPKASDTNVVFTERYASGSSHKSWMTRVGGASNCLTIIVTESQLAITTFFPITLFSDMYDIEHLIPISDITRLTAKGAVIETEFKRSDGTLSKFTLRLRNSAGFLQALQNKLTPE